MRSMKRLTQERSCGTIRAALAADVSETPPQEDRVRVNAKWMVGMVVVILLATVPLMLEGYAFRPLFSIAWYKLIHIVGGVLFIGNIVVTGVWMDMARRTRRPAGRLVRNCHG